MAKINILDKCVYNLISAGEVVENPASIVKELVENSIDAGADSITVNIENGGIKSITVIDNGCGMEADDLPLSVLPHATSKIFEASDLDTVGTLGFRGEALASIAAVSDTTIKSRYFENECAHFIQVKGGEIIDSGMCGLNIGTQISVKSLFFNTPARYKFLKNAKGEENKVTVLMRELIFSNPDVTFSYSADGKIIYKTEGSGLEDAMYAVYGAETAEVMLKIEEISDRGYKINGFTARPASLAIKNNRNRQVFIVNGRIIEDDTLSAVVQNAYGEFLMKRTFPSVIIDIVAPFDMIDVNVHPNKREIRFAEGRVVNGLVYHAVKATVESFAENMQKQLFEQVHASAIGGNINAREDISMRKIEIEIPENVPSFVDETFQVSAPANDESVISAADSSNVYKTKIVDIESERSQFEFIRVNDGRKYEQTMILNDIAYEGSADDALQVNLAPSYRRIGQLFDTYLLIELGEDLILIDQHAAHERLLFDKLLKQFESSLSVQDMLIPYYFSADSDDLAYFIAIKNDLDKLGFKLEIQDDGVYVLSLPALLTGLDINGFLCELLQFNKSAEKLTSSAIIKDKIAKIACKRAIKGGDKLTDEQVDYVLDYFFSEGVPLQCPHGRPTMIKMSRYELERRFGRKV